MASIEQWTEWREEYLDDLHFSTCRCAFIYADFALKNQGISFDASKASALVEEAIDKQYIDYDDSVLIQMAEYCYYSGLHQSRWSRYGVKDAFHDRRLSVEAKTDIISSFDSFNGYYGGVIYFLVTPFVDSFGFFQRNHPLQYREWLLKHFNTVIDLSYCGLSESQLFDYLCSMSKYGLYKTLVDYKYPKAEDLFYSVQNSDYQKFSQISRDCNIDYTDLSQVVGYILNGQSLELLGDKETFQIKSRALAEMAGYGLGDISDILPKIHNPKFVRDVLAFSMTDEETVKITTLAYNIAVYYPLFETLDDEELEVIETVLGNSYFKGFMKIVQYVRLSLVPQLPPRVELLLSSEEMEKYFPSIDIENIYAKEESQNDDPLINSSEQVFEDTLQITNGANISPQFNKEPEEITQGIKTLASRWMTELYQRMTDDVLVEIVSKKIWPQLQDEVDSLKWAPSKRVLPTFQKTKNMMAACILFHALELAKIARLPKQEKEALSEGFYMSAEERAQYGIYETSKRNAGIAHTKKRYNDTLPVGYMETLERFIKEEELPGRTTSRTYLKLVNKWVKTDPDEISDNIYTQAKQLLNESEMEKDLGPQLYLLKDNRVRLKSMLKEWRDLTPELFNIPI